MIRLRTSTFSFTHPQIRLRDRYRFHVYGESKFVSREKRLESNLSISVGQSKAVESSATASSSIMLTSGASRRVNSILLMRALKSVLTLLSAFILLLFLPFRGQKSVSISLGLEKLSKDEKQQRKSKVVQVLIVPWRSSPAAGANVSKAGQEVAARRTIAIWRVMQDKDDKSQLGNFRCTCRREGKLFSSNHVHPLQKDQIIKTFRVIFSQLEELPSLERKNRGLVLVMHGLNKHSSRYRDFAKQLDVNGYKVYGMDWIGLTSLGHIFILHKGQRVY